MKLNTIARAIHHNATAKGFHDDKQPLPVRLMLQVAELAEAMEEHRAGRPAVYFNAPAGGILFPGEPGVDYDTTTGLYSTQYQGNTVVLKPEGWAVEMVDAAIRILDDLVEECGEDVEWLFRMKMSFNATRPAMHGGKAY